MTEAFEFDPVKEAENLQKHGLRFDFAPLLFEVLFIEEEDRRYAYGETRWSPRDRSPC